MSDKSYTTAGGQGYGVRRAPDGSLLVQREGESAETKVALELSAATIDTQTTRLHRQSARGRGLYWVYARGNQRVLSWPGGSLELDATDLTEGRGVGATALKPLKLTMPGKVLSVKVKEGEVVEAGHGLVIVEAMKMENLLLSPARARIAKLHVKTGDRLESGALLVTFSPAEEA